MLTASGLHDFQDYYQWPGKSPIGASTCPATSIVKSHFGQVRRDSQHLEIHGAAHRNRVATDVIAEFDFLGEAQRLGNWNSLRGRLVRRPS
jgi:hypothetical protein